MSFVEPPFWSRAGWRAPAHVALRWVAPVTPPTEPITVVEARDFLRVSTVDDDALINRYITTARCYVERRIERPIVAHTLDVLFDRVYPSPWLTLPIGSVLAVTSITSTNDAGVATVLAPSAYVVDLASTPARLGLAAGGTWPSDVRALQGVAIRVEVGLVPVPEDLVHALRLLVGHYYENRMASVGDERVDAALPFGVDELLAPYEMVSLA